EPAELRVAREGAGGEVEQPRRDHAAAPPHLGDLGEVEIVTLVGRPRVFFRPAQDAETLRISLHQAVLDAVVDHLYEMPGAARTAVEVAALRARVASVASRRARNVAFAGRKRGKNRIEQFERTAVAADHHAVAALEAPHAAAGADVEIMHALGCKPARAA